MRRVLPLLCALTVCACGSEPQTPEGQIRKGDQLLARGDTVGAQTTYRLALGQDSLNADLMARMAKLYASQGKIEPADIYLRRAADLTYRQGIAALQAGDQPAAVATFEHTLAIIPAHPLALLRLGDLALQRGEEARALVYFEQAIQANPEYPESYVKAGKLYLHHQRLADAQEAFAHCIDLNINAIDAYLGLGELFAMQQNPAAAAEQYRKVLLIDPGSSVAKSALAQLGSHP